ncbi:gas vesicle protein GvpO [Halocatena marina]|uniref:gas vesicle protein GvpO n=1 Tax=Halocatena marina TaxID=2934937 RepID=UPI0024144E7D|nr:gas vesicle protein GvpO [Halocatena marina]
MNRSRPSETFSNERLRLVPAEHSVVRSYCRSNVYLSCADRTVTDTQTIMIPPNQRSANDEPNSEDSVAETATKLRSTLDSLNSADDRDERESNDEDHESVDENSNTEMTDKSDNEESENGKQIEDSETKNEGTEDEEKSSETDTDEISTDEAELIEIRDHVQEVAADLIGRDLDGIAAIHRNDSTWTVAVDVVERHSVPDTQDIMGRYEIHLGSNGEIREYNCSSRYRRGDTGYNEW